MKEREWRRPLAFFFAVTVCKHIVTVKNADVVWLQSGGRAPADMLKGIESSYLPQGMQWTPLAQQVPRREDTP